jgi:hypothetical protein
MKTVKIFISSTFRDMNAERDYLNEHVFPRLKEKARERFSIEIEPIDLRWGVTEEDALKGRALEICLETIDECRPFFLCMLGKRYGWVPPLNEIKASDFNDLISSYDLGPDEKEFVKKHYHLQSFNHDAMLYELSIQVGGQPERYIDESIIMGSEVLKIIKTVNNLHDKSSMPIKDIK